MKLGRLAILVGLVAGLGACTDEQIVYVNRPFNPPVDAVNGFLGYFDEAAKQTSCGNCHVSAQQQWVASPHANAWEGLQASGNAAPYCAGCHTVSELGNLAAGPAGYNAVQDASYYDVQCESCHGAGFDHASVPDSSAPPLAKLTAHEGDSLGTCGDCHSGEHTPFVEEWEQSRHAEALAEPPTGSPATNPSCNGCHEGRAVLKAWGVTSRYVESNDVVTYAPNNTIGITCAVCHDPHGSANPAQLRWPISTLDPTQQLCMKCHLRRTVPASGSSRGNTPHAPQGAVLLGDVGYQNPNYLDTLLLNAASAATHASLTSNPRLCAGCHVYRFETTDTAGNFFQVTGHLFRPLPCYDGNGLPTDTITNCAFTPAERSFRACAVSGCHSTQDQAALALSVTRQRMRDLSAVLWVDGDGDRTIDTTGVDFGILAAVKLNTLDLNPTAAPVTPADGAEFNVRTVGEDATGFLYDNGDKSHAVHNPFVAEALLRANIQELTDLYGGQPWFPSISPAAQRILTGPLGASGSVSFPRPDDRVSSR